MSKHERPGRAKAHDYGEPNYWIDHEFGPPSLASLTARITAFRADPNDREARVSGEELAEFLRQHGVAACPQLVLDYLFDFLEGSLPRPTGREPLSRGELRAYAHLRDEYRDLREKLQRLDRDGGLEAWRASNGYDKGYSVSELAIKEICREYRPPMSERRLLNLFSELPD